MLIGFERLITPVRAQQRVSGSVEALEMRSISRDVDCVVGLPECANIAVRCDRSTSSLIQGCVAWRL